MRAARGEAPMKSSPPTARPCCRADGSSAPVEMERRNELVCGRQPDALVHRATLRNGDGVVGRHSSSSG
ncbi:unnamed protein product [Lampetra planeri]